MRVHDKDLQDLIHEHWQEGRMNTTALLRELQSIRRIMPKVREALEKVEHCYSGTSNPHSPIDVWDAMFKDAVSYADEALALLDEVTKGEM